MTYELAKKLKEAGYSFREVSHEDIISGLQKVEANKYIRIDDLGDWYWVSPTLEELIEACGDKLKGLMRIRSKWAAIEVVGEIEQTGEGWLWSGWVYWDGDTPKEAVANLWLKLNT